jgi:membrane-associated phospholipid phosphatase
MRETSARIPRSSQKPLGGVLDQIPRVVAQPRLSLESTPVSAAATAARSRILPNGLLDLLRQLAIWFGFLWAYRYTRGVADRDSYEAFQNGLRIADVEHRLTGLWELSLQSLVMSSGLLRELTSWTYWHSQFTVLGLVMLWVYLRRNDAFVRFRNTLLLANLIGLVGFVLAPTAPPRLFPELGFVDTLAGFGINHDSAIVRADANPYAAMPSLHAADALIVGVGLFLVVRTQWLRYLWLLWPVWVWFSVMATGNHFWLDILAGIVVAAVAGAVVNNKYLRRRFARPRPVPA